MDDDAPPVKSIGLPAQSFIRQVTVLMSGVAGAQAMTMAFAPLITRLYGPEAFGVQGLFLSLISLLAPFAALGYPYALVLPPGDAAARALVRLSMIASFVVATCLGVVLFFHSAFVVLALGLQAIEPYLFVLPIVVILSALLQLTEQWLVRKEDFGALARASLAQSFLVNCARAGLGLNSPTAAALISATTIGLAVNAGLNLMARNPRETRTDLRPADRTSLLEIARDHKDFPIYRVPEMFLTAMSASLPIFILATAFGVSEAGFYALARSVLYLPVSLLGNSVAHAYYPRFNRQARSQEPLLPMFLQTVSTLALVGLPVFGAVALFGPELFSIAFGSAWQPAGDYARWLTIWLFFTLVNRPCIGATSVLGAQRMFLVQGILSFALRVGGLWIGWRMNSDLWAIALFSVGGGIAALMLVILVATRIVRADKSKARA